MESPGIIRKKLRNTPKDPPKVLTIEDLKHNKQFMYVKDIRHTLKHYGLGDNITGIKKTVLEEMLVKLFDNLSGFEVDKNVYQITKIQALFRARKIRRDIELYGIGIINRRVCNNTEDFYTFEPIDDIEKEYFFSYKDVDNFVYFFDIRSFKKLMDKNLDNP